ncbi:hypothetical protein COOONC_00687, partial [Cooperia oncophora]
FAFKTGSSFCTTASHKEGFGFAIRYVIPVLFNKTSRLNPHPHLHMYGGLQYDKDVTDIGFGMFVCLLRTAYRANENPFTNGYLTTITTVDGSTPEPPATGMDFSQMYYELPFMVLLEISYMKEPGHEQKLISYQPSKCAETAKWWASEGYYKLDTETEEWTPVYYYPINTDFYY